MVFPQFSGVVLLDSVLPDERSSMGRRGYPPEFRRKVLDLVEAGRVEATSCHAWRRKGGVLTDC